MRAQYLLVGRVRKSGRSIRKQLLLNNSRHGMGVCKHSNNYGLQSVDQDNIPVPHYTGMSMIGNMLSVFVYTMSSTVKSD